MGMTIDEHIAQLKKLKSFHNGSYGTSINLAISMMRKCQMMQADHKADMVDMLTEIQAEIEKLDLEDSIPSYTRGAEDTRDYIANMLEEKIDKLKEHTE